MQGRGAVSSLRGCRRRGQTRWERIRANPEFPLPGSQPLIGPLVLIGVRAGGVPRDR